MVTSCSPKMPKTVEGYQKLAQRDLELIEAQREEIAKLKGAVNDLQQKIDRYKHRTENGAYFYRNELMDYAAKAIEAAIKECGCNDDNSICFVRDLREFAKKLRGEK